MKFFLTFEEKCAKVKEFTNSPSSIRQPNEKTSMANRYLAYSIEANCYFGYKKVAEYFFAICASLKADDLLESIHWIDGVDENGVDIPYKKYADPELN